VGGKNRKIHNSEDTIIRDSREYKMFQKKSQKYDELGSDKPPNITGYLKMRIYFKKFQKLRKSTNKNKNKISKKKIFI